MTDKYIEQAIRDVDYWIGAVVVYLSKHPEILDEVKHGKV